MTILAAWTNGNDPYSAENLEQYFVHSAKIIERSDKEESTRLTIIAGILFFIGSVFYLIGCLLEIPLLSLSITGVDAWIFDAVAAVVFVLCGCVQYANYMGNFHIFFVFGGTFGLIAAILDGPGQQATSVVYLNFVANHMYFVQAVKLYQSHQGMDILMREITTKYIWLGTQGIGDVFFIVSTAINVGLSWMVIVSAKSHADFSSRIPTEEEQYFQLGGASLWFLCSILTLVVYIRMGKVVASSVAGDEQHQEDNQSATSHETESLVSGQTRLSTRV